MSESDRGAAELLAFAEASLDERGRQAARVLRAAIESGTNEAAVANLSLLRERAWTNYGGNLHSPRVARQYVVTGDLADGISAVRAVVGEADRTDARLRPLGSGWSFSGIISSPEWTLSLTGMSGAAPVIPPDAIASGVDPSLIAHVLGGTIIHRINEMLEAGGRTLAVMGGNGGQAIAGAIATGTHGAWLGQPSVSDFVRGIGLVAADSKAYWIEPKSAPLTRGSFDGFGQYRVVRDDTLFAAAQASLGLLGVVTSLALEVRPLRWAQVERRARAFDAALETACFDLDFGPLGIPRPDHFLVVLNPHEPASSPTAAYVETGRRVDPVPGAARPTPLAPVPAGEVQGGIGWDILAHTINQSPHLVPALLDLALPMSYPAREIVGPLSQVFPRSTGGAPMLSMEIAVSREKARSTWDALAKIVELSKPRFHFPGVIGIRHQTGSSALLGFTRYPETVTFELIFIRGVSGVDHFFKELDLELTARSARHTFHPGQIERWDANRMRRLLHPGYDAFKDAMRGLSSKSARRFGNATTDEWGLSA